MCNKLYRLIYVLKVHVSQQLLKEIVALINTLRTNINEEQNIMMGI